MKYVKYLIFKIENRKYAIELNHVNGTEQKYSIIPIPDAPDGIQGLINLRGKLIPVYSLRQRFGLNPRITDPGKSALIARTSGIMIAYEVDAIDFIEELEADDVQTMPKMATNDETTFMNKVLNINNQIIVVIDVNKVLSDEAIEVLERLIEERTEADKKEEGKKIAEQKAKEEELARSLEREASEQD